MNPGSPHTIDLEEANRWLQDFPKKMESLILATVNPANGFPYSSYAPFVMGSAGEYYIFVSALAQHTSNLAANPNLSVMLVEDESKSNSVFARKRLTLQCLANSVERNTPEWKDTADKFESRFGEIFMLLRRLPDFQMYRLEVAEGLLVMGFGKAYPLIDGILHPPRDPNSDDDSGEK